MKNNIVAALLALIFGGLGIHWYYLGNNKKGTTYLILTIAGFLTSWLLIGLIPLCLVAILALIDAVQLLIMPIETFNEKYNTPTKQILND